jgi:hypothetical protein
MSISQPRRQGGANGSLDAAGSDFAPGAVGGFGQYVAERPVLSSIHQRSGDR